jgi:chlorobactene lauroyltransferase
LKSGTIEARPARWASFALHALIRAKVRKQFHAWSYFCEQESVLRDQSLPLLFVPNHSSWWDGFFAFELAAQLGQRFYVMMQADQLRAITFFARVGAFSMEREHPRQAYRDLQYAAKLLVPGHGVWVFPQGRRAPADAPLELESGVARLASWGAPVRVVPVAMRYQFLSEEYPEAFAYFGTPWVVTAADTPVELGVRLTRELAATRERLDRRLALSGREGFSCLLNGAPSSNKRLDAWLAAKGLVPPERARNG